MPNTNAFTKHAGIIKFRPKAVNLVARATGAAARNLAIKPTLAVGKTILKHPKRTLKGLGGLAAVYTIGGNMLDKADKYENIITGR